MGVFRNRKTIDANRRLRDLCKAEEAMPVPHQRPCGIRPAAPAGAARWRADGRASRHRDHSWVWWLRTTVCQASEPALESWSDEPSALLFFAASPRPSTSNTKKMVRPANFPEDVPGQGMVFVKVNQLELAVINLQARTFMVPLEDPFKKAAELVAIARKRTPLIFVDFHGETTSEKQAMSWFLDGQVSAVVGTHTHVQTNDARILPKGTAFLSDVGMTGPYDGILGMKREPII